MVSALFAARHAAALTFQKALVSHPYSDSFQKINAHTSLTHNSHSVP